MNVWLSADAIEYPGGGGHLWAYLNWALGLRSIGCDVTWLEGSEHPDRLKLLSGLRASLGAYALDRAIAMWSIEEGRVVDQPGCVPLEAAADADLLVNLRYTTPDEIVGRFRRSVLVDIDPGLLQTWISKGEIDLPPHDAYLTTGENGFADPDREWQQTRPCVALDWWPRTGNGEAAPFTTVSHWWAEEWFEADGRPIRNDKRSAFLDYLDLPRRSNVPLELTLSLSDEDEEERARLVGHGWRVRHASEVASTPEAYRRYIQGSRGEFTCVKPSCVLLQNGWIGDRTICYLASGKPVVVQHTGPSSVLPDAAGMWRFRTPAEAASSLAAVTEDYERQCRLARELAEEHFAADKVVGELLERVVW